MVITVLYLKQSWIMISTEYGHYYNRGWVYFCLRQISSVIITPFKYWKKLHKRILRYVHNISTYILNFNTGRSWWVWSYVSYAWLQKHMVVKWGAKLSVYTYLHLKHEVMILSLYPFNVLSKFASICCHWQR